MNDVLAFRKQEKPYFEVQLLYAVRYRLCKSGSNVVYTKHRFSKSTVE